MKVHLQYSSKAVQLADTCHSTVLSCNKNIQYTESKGIGSTENISTEIAKKLIHILCYFQSKDVPIDQNWAITQ